MNRSSTEHAPYLPYMLGRDLSMAQLGALKTYQRTKAALNLADRDGEAEGLPGSLHPLTSYLNVGWLSRYG